MGSTEFVKGFLKTDDSLRCAMLTQAVLRDWDPVYFEIQKQMKINLDGMPHHLTESAAVVGAAAELLGVENPINWETGEISDEVTVAAIEVAFDERPSAFDISFWEFAAMFIES